MSGFEVVGIALAVLPIVLKSVDAYKGSIRRVVETFRKRKHVRKLACALLLQQQILQAIVNSIVHACGCEDVGALEEDAFGYFSNVDVQERVEDYLGPKNTVAFISLVTENNDIVKRVAEKISGLVPAEKVCFHFSMPMAKRHFFKLHAKYGCRDQEMT